MSRLTRDPVTREWVPAEEYMARKAMRAGVNNVASELPCPQVLGDIPEYISPLGTGLVTSRSQRREEMKRHGCREVDPSEFKPKYINPKNKALSKASS